MPKYNINIVLTTNHPIVHSDLKDYVNTALKEECKHYHPDDVFSNLVKTSRVISLKKRPMRQSKPSNVVTLVKRSHK